MNNAARSNQAATQAVSIKSPEAFAARFANIQRQANLTGLGHRLVRFEWESDPKRLGVRLSDGRSFGIQDWLGDISLAISVADEGDNEIAQRNYRNLWKAAVELSDDLADWHTRHGNEPQPDIDFANDIEVSR